MNVFTEVADDVTYVGYHKIESKIHKTYQILVRPDVSEDSLLTLAQQILITSSGAVTRHAPASGIESANDHTSRHTNMINGEFNRSTPSPTNANVPKEELKANKDKSAEKLLSPYLEAVNSTIAGASVPWQVIRVYLGVNMDLQRCLVLAVQPTAAAAGVNTVSSGLSSLGGEVGVVQRSGMPGVFRGIGVNTYSIAAELTSNDTATTNTTATTTITAPTPYLSAARRSFLEYCEQLAFELNTAMREESLTADYLTSVPASMTGPMQGLHNVYSGGAGIGGGGNSRALDSLVDLAFIRDLHCATVQLMTLRLLEQADKLDFRTRIIEQKCARLMTLLKPSFVRAKLDLPVPPMSRAVHQYELHLERAAIGESCSVDVWKLVLLRARRKCREVLQLRGQVAIGGSSDASGNNNNTSIYNITTPDTRTETQIVLDCIIEQFVVWAQEEYKQRLYRKINSVKDRLETIHAFRIQLILNLHERFVVNGTTNTTTSSSWLFNTNPDLTYQRSIREKFPFLDLTEPVLFDTSAILLSSKYGVYDAAAAALNGKTGTMYLSLGYMMFYCGGGFLGTPAEIVVVPLHSVVLLELVGSDGTLVCFRYSMGDISSVVDSGGVGSDGREGLVIQQGDKSVNILSPVKTNPNISTTSTINTASSTTANTTNTTNTTNTNAKPHIPPSARQPSSLRLVDSTCTIDVTLNVTGLTDDYVRRVADLLDLIIKDKMYKLREPHSTPLSTSTTTTNNTRASASGTYHTISDIDDIMDLLALPTSDGGSGGSGGSNSDGNNATGSVSNGSSGGAIGNTTADGEPAENSTSSVTASTSIVSNSGGGSSVVHAPALLNSTTSNTTSNANTNTDTNISANTTHSVPTTTTTTTTTLPARAVLTNRPAATVVPRNTMNTSNATNTTNTTTTAISAADADFDNLLLSTTHSTTNNTDNNTTTVSAFGFINSTASNTTTTEPAVSSPFDTVPSLLIPTNTATLPTSTVSGVQRSDSSHLLEVDNFFNELTIHTPTSSLSNTGTHTPTNNTSMYGDVFGNSSVLLPTTPSGVLGYTSSATNSNHNSSNNILTHSNSTNLLNTTLSNSRSSNSISNIHVDLNTKPNSSKSTGELFNDLIFGTVGTASTTKAPSVTSPKIASPVSGSINSADSKVSGSSVVRTPALSTTTPAPKPVITANATTSATTSDTPVAAAVKPVLVPTTAAPKPMSATLTTATPTTTTSTTPSVAPEAVAKLVAVTPAPASVADTGKTATAAATGNTDLPAPAPVKKSLGGNIQKFLAQSQAQKAKQAADSANAGSTSAGDKK